MYADVFFRTWGWKTHKSETHVYYLYSCRCLFVLVMLTAVWNPRCWELNLSIRQTRCQTLVSRRWTEVYCSCCVSQLTFSIIPQEQSLSPPLHLTLRFRARTKHQTETERYVQAVSDAPLLTLMSPSGIQTLGSKSSSLLWQSISHFQLISPLNHRTRGLDRVTSHNTGGQVCVCVCVEFNTLWRLSSSAYREDNLPPHTKMMEIFTLLQKLCFQWP